MSLRIATSELIAGSLVIGDAGLGVLGSQVPSTGTSGAGLLYNDLTLPAENNDEFICRILTSPAGGSLFVFEDSSFTATGYADGTYGGTYQGFKNGVSYGTAAFSFTVGAVVAPASFSSAKTDGADTFAATAEPQVGASSATTDGADVFAASVTVVSSAIAFSSATTDGADVATGAVGVLVSATSAKTDGVDVLTANVAVGNVIGVSAAISDGADGFTAGIGLQISASIAAVDGTDVFSAFVSSLITARSNTFDGADDLVASGVLGFVEANVLGSLVGSYKQHMATRSNTQTARR